MRLGDWSGSHGMRCFRYVMLDWAGYASDCCDSEHPERYFWAMTREFDLMNGIAAYHLQALEGESFIRSVRDGLLKRFNSTDVKVPRDQRAALEDVRPETPDLVASQPGISQKRIVNELGIDGETVRYHLRVLLEQEELRDAHEGRHAVYYRET